MKKIVFIFLLSSFLNAGQAAVLNALNFEQRGELSYFVLEFDQKEVEVEKLENKTDKQLILDMKGVTSTEKVTRPFNTAEFSGSSIFVSTYPKPGSPQDLRLAIQLRENVRSKIIRENGKVILAIENRFGAFDDNEVSFNDSPVPTQEKIKAASSLNVPKSAAIEDILENLTLSGQKKYIGKSVSFNVKNVSVQDLLKMIADSSGFNIILTDEVKTLPPLSLNLNNVPWDQALDTILGLNKLVAKKNGSILTVTTLEKATKEKMQEIEAQNLVVRETPLVTKLFPISFSTLTEIEGIVREYLTKERGSISKDERTNILIVKDTPETIEKVRRIVEELDKQTPQVLIEARVVEVRDNSAKEFGFRNGVNFGYDPIGASANARNQIGTPTADINPTLNFGPGFSFSSAPVGGETPKDMFGLSIGKLGRLVNLDFKLQLMESESKVKIVSTPKIVTQNKKSAEIKAINTTSFAVTEGAGEDAVTTFREYNADLILNVTPQVTNEGSIALDVTVKKDQFGTRPAAGGPPDKTSNNVKTSVLVENGSTVILGGVYTFSKTEGHSGVPFLKDIPLIGWFFRTPYNPATNKSELVVFLTPRIINQEEAGLGEAL